MDLLKSDFSKQDSKLMRQRTLWAILTTLGRPCTATHFDSTKHSGIIHTLCKKGVILYEKSDSESVKVSIPIENIISVQCPNIQTVNKSKFKTDKEISKKNKSQKRTLQQWEGEESSSLNLDLKDYKSWDQFETNKQKFGVTSTYDENLYTTPVPSLSELTEEQVLRAKTVEKELGICSVEIEENEEDEEALFGAVLGSGRYEGKKEENKRKEKKKPKKKTEEGMKKFVNSKKNKDLEDKAKEDQKTGCKSIFGLYVSAWGKCLSIGN